MSSDPIDSSENDPQFTNKIVPVYACTQKFTL